MYFRFCTAIIAYALMFNMEKLSGSLYLNNVIYGIIRYSFNLSFGVADYKIPTMGRKLVHRISVSFVAFMLLFVFFIKAFGNFLYLAKREPCQNLPPF